ncbi:MAG: DUF5668 domain-containing protein [Bacillota bacterium]|nr:DUF5668 domain-containing protein [Bacillota bacterium]
MRKVGTITSALGLILYGIWMIIKQMTPTLGTEVLKFWPVIFIILGLEIIAVYSKRNLEKRPGFNAAVIFVIILFLLTNVFYVVRDGVRDKLNIGDISWNEPSWSTKKLEVEKSINFNGKNFIFKTNNGDIKILKSDSKDIKLQLDIYVREGSNINSYDIKENNDNDNCRISIDDGDVRRVSGTIYIPDGLNVSIDNNNLNITSQDNLANTTFNINSNNGKIDISNIAELKAEVDNGEVNVKDVKTIGLKSHNGAIRINGACENIDIDANNSGIKINNILCRNVNISTNNGAIDLITQDNNIDVKLSTDAGIMKINSDEKNRGELNKIIGNGEGKVKIKTNLGAIKVSSQE